MHLDGIVNNIDCYRGHGRLDLRNPDLCFLNTGIVDDVRSAQRQQASHVDIHPRFGDPIVVAAEFCEWPAECAARH